MTLRLRKGGRYKLKKPIIVARGIIIQRGTVLVYLSSRGPRAWFKRDDGLELGVVREKADKFLESARGTK